MNIEYTKEEAQAAIQLYDLAVKANGLVVSEAAVHLTKKLQNAFKSEDEGKSEDKTEEVAAE